MYKYLAAMFVGMFFFVSQAHAETEMLPAPWNFTVTNGAVEKYQSIPASSLNGKISVTLKYNLHGTTLLGGDASAIIFDQNGWKYISLSSYGVNGMDGEQTVTIPLSAFGVNTSTNVGSFHSRIWKSGGPYTIDITSAVLNEEFQPTWSVQSVDVMKYSKDVVCNQPTQAFIDQSLDKIVELGGNYVAVSTPYDSPSCGDSNALATKWITSARAKGLHIWHRHTGLAFEGLYSVSKNRSPDGDRHLKVMTDWIINNPTLVQPGDIFTPFPEPQNGGISGISYCPGICQFSSKADFNEWLRLAQMSAKLAIKASGDSVTTTFGNQTGVFVGAYGFDGYITWCDNNPDCVGQSKIESATLVAMDNNLTIDHYPASGATMEGDLTEARAVFPTADFVIGEWGTIGAANDTEREQRATDAFVAFASKSWIKGVNYWHLGPGTGEGLINTDFTNRPSFDVIKTFFK